LDCPRKRYVNLVRQTSYTTTPAVETSVKLCAKLRALDVPEACPHFTKGEQITRFLDGKKTKGKRKRREMG